MSYYGWAASTPESHGKALLIEEAASAGVVFGPPILLSVAGGYLGMNVCKPLTIHKVAHSIPVETGGCANLHAFPVEGTRPDLKKFKECIACSPTTAIQPKPPLER